MRNLSQYPITTAGIVEALTQARDDYNACCMRGGINGVCIDENLDQASAKASVNSRRKRTS